MGDEKPKKKSFPPYVWIHIKDYMLQEYWMKQYNSALKELPKYNTFLYPKTSTKNGKPFKMYTTATVFPQFVKTFHENGIVTIKDPIITYTIYKSHI